MRLSSYNVTVPLEDDNYILYNTLSRQYLIYNKSNKPFLEILLENPKKPEYTGSDIKTLKKLFKKNILLYNDIDELSIIEFEENSTRFRNGFFCFVIQPTLDCNFRCTYCYEEHKKVAMDNNTENRIIKLVENVMGEAGKLHIAWFGGEPLMEIDRIRSLTHKIKKICADNRCEYTASMTTNGYLFTDDLIDNIEDLAIGQIQVTLDGAGEYHNKKRPLEDGKGTYEIIKDNLIKLSYKDILIYLRVNTDKENYNRIDEVFDIVPQSNRHKVYVNISNLFQERDPLNLYDLYKTSIDKGYPYYNDANSFTHCEVCMKNGFTIEPDGRIVPCSTAAETGFSFGYLDENGNHILKNPDFYYKLKNVSALKSAKCRECVQMPMCMGGCKFSRYNDNDICNGKAVGGMSLIDKIKLHYYSDIKQGRVTEEDIL